MNSIFHQNSVVLRSLTRDELLRWIETEGLSLMPPIIQVLVEHLRDACSPEELDEKLDALYEKWEKALEKGTDSLNEQLSGMGTELSDSVDKLDTDYVVLLDDGTLVKPSEVTEDEPTDKLVITRKDFEEFYIKAVDISEGLKRIETYEYFDTPD